MDLALCCFLSVRFYELSHSLELMDNFQSKQQPSLRLVSN